jgi:RimJ/RimL family protein N-acetyltransferase
VEIRSAEKGDLDAISDIFDAARLFMSESGNPHQWTADYPGRRDAKRDIRRGTQFVCTDEGKVVGCFDFEPGPEPYYRVLEEGQWLNKFDYFVIHRFAVLHSGRGIGRTMLDWACHSSNNIRVDTHKDNVPMQALLRRFGFVRCGTVRLPRGGFRVVYHYARPDERPTREGMRAWLC